MGSNIHLLGNPDLHTGYSVISHYRHLRGAQPVVYTLTLVHIPTGFEAKGTNKRERGILAKGGSRKKAAVFDKFVSQIILVNTDGNRRRLGSYLEKGIGNLTIVFVSLF